VPEYEYPDLEELPSSDLVHLDNFPSPEEVWEDCRRELEEKDHFPSPEEVWEDCLRELEEKDHFPSAEEV